MLFIAMGKPRAGSPQERIGRRMKWRYPEGLHLVAEYWPQGGEYSGVIIYEADSVAPIMAALAAWEDVYEFTVTPAVTAEEGLRLAQQMVQH